MDVASLVNGVVTVAVLLLAVVSVAKSVKVVPQSERWVVERFGRYTRTLGAGLSLIVPWLDRVAKRVSVLERQLPAFAISVITRDNVEIGVESTVFFRIDAAHLSVYRIADVDQAIHTMATSVVRSAAGKLELDDIQSSREKMNHEIEKNMEEAAKEWGIQITRTEITDVSVDEETKDAQRQQLNAARQRRAMIEKAEGERRVVELKAEADLFAAKKNAEAIRINADAEAYAITKKAEADAEQTKLIANAIRNEGQPAVDYEIRKRQVTAIGELAKSENKATMLVPAEVVGVLGAVEAVADRLRGERR